MALRFRDWMGLNAEQQAQLSASAGDFARRLEPRLNAFAAFESGAVAPVRGVLDGMPYTAKDIFLSVTRIPHGGFARPLPMMKGAQAIVLDLLNRAGGRRIAVSAVAPKAGHSMPRYRESHGSNSRGNASYRPSRE